MIRIAIALFAIVAGILLASSPGSLSWGKAPKGVCEQHCEEFNRKFFSKKELFRKRIENQLSTQPFSAWTYSAWAEGLASMYQATGDTRYLSELADIVRLTLFASDGRQTPDFEKLNIGQASLILSPAARLFGFLQEDSKLADEMRLSPDKLQQVILQKLTRYDAHLRSRRSANGENLRYYIQVASGSRQQEECDPAGPPCPPPSVRVQGPEPYNIQLKAGIVWLHLNTHLKRDDIHQRIRGLYSYFLQTSDLRTVPTPAGAARVFRYAENGRPEDVSHFNLTIDFMQALLFDYQPSSPFPALASSDVAVGMLRAFTELAGRQDKATGKYYLTPYIDGSRPNSHNPKLSRSCQQVMAFAQVDPQIRRVCENLGDGIDTANGLAYTALGLSASRAPGTLR